MIDHDHKDSYLTPYDPDAALLDKVRALAAAEGLSHGDRRRKRHKEKRERR